MDSSTDVTMRVKSTRSWQSDAVWHGCFVAVKYRIQVADGHVRDANVGRLREAV